MEKAVVVVAVISQLALVSTFAWGSNTFSVKVNGRGSLQEIRIKWPKFKQVSTPLKPAQDSEILAKATQILSKASPITNGQQVLEPKKAILTGLAYAWLPIEIGGNIILTPCYSYSTSVDYEGDQIMKPFIDVPQSEKYLQ